LEHDIQLFERFALALWYEEKCEDERPDCDRSEAAEDISGFTKPSTRVLLSCNLHEPDF
jgi:hypothetical protein